MDQLLDLLDGLEVSKLASKEVHVSVILALEEVTRHQRTLRGVLDRLERRQNREERLKILKIQKMLNLKALNSL